MRNSHLANCREAIRSLAEPNTLSNSRKCTDRCNHRHLSNQIASRNVYPPAKKDMRMHKFCKLHCWYNLQLRRYRCSHRDFLLQQGFLLRLLNNFRQYRCTSCCFRLLLWSMKSCYLDRQMSLYKVWECSRLAKELCGTSHLCMHYFHQDKQHTPLRHNRSEKQDLPRCKKYR